MQVLNWNCVTPSSPEERESSLNVPNARKHAPFNSTRIHQTMRTYTRKRAATAILKRRSPILRLLNSFGVQPADLDPSCRFPIPAPHISLNLKIKKIVISEPWISLGTLK